MKEQIEGIEKRYWHMDEVAALTGLNPSHIRFYDKEFNMNVRRNGKGERYFSRPQVEQLGKMKDLLKFFNMRGLKVIIACGKLDDVTWLTKLRAPGRPSASRTQEGMSNG